METSHTPWAQVCPAAVGGTSAPCLIALVRAGALVLKGKLPERPVDISPPEPQVTRNGRHLKFPIRRVLTFFARASADRLDALFRSHPSQFSNRCSKDAVRPRYEVVLGHQRVVDEVHLTKQSL